MARKTTQSVETMRELREMLKARIENYELLIEARKRSILDDPSDGNLAKQLLFIHEYEKHIEEIWKVDSELRFDSEDLTGEEEK